MRILIVTGIFPPDIGGPATYVPRIASALVERGHSVKVVTLSQNYQHHLFNFSFEIVRIRRDLWKPWRLLITIYKLFAMAKQSDIIFVNGLALETVLANFFLGKPLVIKVVGDLIWEKAVSSGWITDNFEEFQTAFYGPRIKFLKWLQSCWIRAADAIVVPSEYLAAIVSAWGARKDRIFVIFNSFESPSSIVPKIIPLPVKFKMATAARLVPWKGIKGLLEVISKHQDWGLIVIGDGPELQRLQEMTAELSLIHRVHFAGHQNRQRMLELIAGADSFVLNSSYEGLPHIVLEAMSVGVPVIATNIGGTAEVISDGKSGILVETGNNESLSNAISRIENCPELREQLITQSKCELTRFEYSRMVNETENLLMAVNENVNCYLASIPSKSEQIAIPLERNDYGQ